jgi:hypothetical protein
MTMASASQWTPGNAYVTVDTALPTFLSVTVVPTVAGRLERTGVTGKSVKLLPP